jgi:Xaa-Pro aminopeptidase
MKLGEFQRHLKKESVDLAIFVHSEACEDHTITYFTQMKPSFAFMLVTPTKATLYLTSLDHHPKIKGITVKSIPRKWKEILGKMKCKTVGINKGSLTVNYAESFRKIWKKRKFVDVGQKIHELRAQKTPDEIRKIAKACQVTTDSLAALVRELPKKRLKTEQDVAFFLEKYFRNHGCEVGFPTIAAMGKNAAVPHHVTDNTKLKRGFLLLDFGARYKNYNADMSRMLFLGTPAATELQWYNLLKSSQQAGLDVVSTSKTFIDLDKASRKVLGKYQKNFTHSLGHGIGIEVHEAPVFSQNQKILPNHVFTIEPGIYFPGKMGFRIEDTLVWDGTKVKVLTKATKELVKIKR